jgi:hypothetical protein
MSFTPKFQVGNQYVTRIAHLFAIVNIEFVPVNDCSFIWLQQWQMLSNPSTVFQDFLPDNLPGELDGVKMPAKYVTAR